MEYVEPVTPGHCVADPVIEPGVVGVPAETVTAIVDAVEVPHVFPAVTVILPF
jgi:hypothetical protein